MIISKCPLRVSLVGGSTDLHEFIEEYGMGQVISFPCTLYTYITLSERYDNLYRINYSHSETVKDPNEIGNDIAREVIRHFDLPPVTITFNSDIPASGSGLASSSSYMVALVDACNKLLGLNMGQHQVCKIAHELELRINPLTGYQDSVGCGIGELKRIKFYSDEMEFTYIDSNVLLNNNLYLVPTNIVRQSTNILKTIDIHKSYDLLQSVNKLSAARNDHTKFHEYMNEAWERKKKTSDSIMNKKLTDLELSLKSRYNVKSLKLCGAGGGGFFFIITEDQIEDAVKVNIDNVGVQSWDV